MLFGISELEIDTRWRFRGIFISDYQAGMSGYEY